MNNIGELLGIFLATSPVWIALILWFICCPKEGIPIARIEREDTQIFLGYADIDKFINEERED